MSIVTAFLPVRALDGFIYSGHLIVVDHDHVVRTVPLREVAGVLAKQDQANALVYRLAFERNDWLSNEQGRALFSDAGTRRALQRGWRSVARSEAVVQSELLFRPIATLTSAHLQDCRFYAMTAYFAAREGVFQAQIDFSERDDRVSFANGVERVFDLPTLSLSAKAGELVMSGGNEGLFHAGVTRHMAGLQPRKAPNAQRSVRTAWSGYDLVNYLDQKAFHYLKNTWELIGRHEMRPYRFSDMDDTRERVRITSFGEDQFSAEQVLPSAFADWANVTFAQNSNEHCFLVLRDNACLALRWRKDTADRPPHLSERPRTIGRLRGGSSLGVPTNAAAFPNGLVLEYFDQVFLLFRNRVRRIENQPAIATRTFMTSRRFRQLILVVREDGIRLHCVLPDPETEMAPWRALRSSQFFAGGRTLNGVSGEDLDEESDDD